MVNGTKLALLLKQKKIEIRFIKDKTGAAQE